MRSAAGGGPGVGLERAVEGAARARRVARGESGVGLRHVERERRAGDERLVARGRVVCVARHRRRARAEVRQAARARALVVAERSETVLEREGAVERALRAVPVGADHPREREAEERFAPHVPFRVVVGERVEE